MFGLHAQLACLWEATARKPGNVHRYRDFDDIGYIHFLNSAAAIAPIMEVAHEHSLGQTIFEAVRRTRLVAPSNTNLGIILLLAPLAAVPWPTKLAEGVGKVIDAVDVDDTATVYAAIRLAQPGGMGEVPEQDVNAEPTKPFREVMALAADRDLIARQYANDFREVLDEGMPALVAGLERTGCLEGGIIWCHLTLLANHPDSLLARKRGLAEAKEGSRQARAVLEGRLSAEELDAWLRAEGHGRNPGTTADLVTASLFIALREGILALPLSYPWTSDRVLHMKK